MTKRAGARQLKTPGVKRFPRFCVNRSAVKGGAVKYAAVLLMLVLMALPSRGQTATEEARESLPPRRLSDMTKSELAACLKREPGRFSIMSIADNEEAYRYAEDWREVFTSAGWQIDRKDIPIQTFRIVGGMWHGMRVRVHDASPAEGQTALLATGSPEENFAQCVNGRRDIPTGGRIIKYKDRPTGSVSIQVSDQP
jgi:hypothetical protein